LFKSHPFPKSTKEKMSVFFQESIEICILFMLLSQKSELLDMMTREKGVELPILQVVLNAGQSKPLPTYRAYQEMGKIESILARFIEDKKAS